MRANRLAVCGLAAAVAASAGCSTMSNTEKGAGLGGLLGAGVGTAIGAATGNPKTGAVVGGLVGAGVGGIAGNNIDNEQAEKREARETAVAVAQARATQLGTTEVMQMAQGGQSDAVIIQQIKSTGSTFQLSPGDLNMLKQNGVSDAVIMEMQAARPRTVVAPVRRETVVVHEPTPVFVQQPVYVAPPPPRPLIVGGYYRRW